jgi:D-alanine-D-alanine ligase
VQLLPNGGDIAAAIRSSREAAADDSGPAAVLVEPYVMGREMTVGVLDLEGFQIQSFPVIEIRTAQGEWYDFTNRYTAGRSEHILPAPLSPDASLRIREIGIRAHQALGLHELSRADLIVTDDESITLLEVNTLPGMTPTSLYPDGARASGYSFPELMRALVESALRRHTAIQSPN